MQTERRIIFHGSFFPEFYAAQPAAVQEKIEYVFRLIQQVERVPEKFLKHLTGTDGLYEIRVEVSKNIYRIFCCFDQVNLVVLFNAFQKKSQKAPLAELARAEKLKADYFHHQSSTNARL